jgi:protein gp37
MSKIQWTEETWNPVVGCTPVSPGCLNCYAGTLAPRLAAMGQAQYADLTVHRCIYRHPGSPTRAVFNGTVRCLDDALGKPLARKKPTMYFVCSMGDLFHEAVPFEFIDRVFAVMALCPQHTFQVLTKRPERMAEYLSGATAEGSERVPADKRRRNAIADAIVHGWSRWRDYPRPCPAFELRSGHTWPLPNVWLGTSVEDQARLDERVPHLLRCPAAVRFLSCEPLLGALEFGATFYRYMSKASGLRYQNVHSAGDHDVLPGVDWVIVGGESGAHARYCETTWIRGVVDQCKATGVPVFVKQLGARCLSWGPDDRIYADWEFYAARGYVQPNDCWELPLRDRKGGDMAEWPEDLRVREMPSVAGVWGVV